MHGADAKKIQGRVVSGKENRKSVLCFGKMTVLDSRISNISMKRSKEGDLRHVLHIVLENI